MTGTGGVPLDRRRVLGLGAALGAGLVTGACTSDPAPPPRPVPTPTPALVRRARRRPFEPAEVPTRFWDAQARAPREREVEGFADRVSVLPGEPVRLFLSSTAPEVRVTAYRVGWYAGAGAARVWASGTVPARLQPPGVTTGPLRTVVAPWEPTLTVPTAGWRPGAYLLRLDASSGGSSMVPLVVRSTSTAGALVLSSAVATWQAYNAWGGRSLYHGTGGLGDDAGRSLAVSFDRPYDKGGDDIFRNYELPVVQLAERLGLPVAYTTSVQLDSDPSLLSGAKALVSLGHDEYWSVAMRQHATAARDAGTNIAFLGANACYRRIRFGETELGSGRLVTCYKGAWHEDPYVHTDPAQVTTDWRADPHPEPEATLVGPQYEGFPVRGDYTVTNAGSWVFAGTGLRDGDTLPRLAGPEYDRVMPQPGLPAGLELLAHSKVVCRGVRTFQDSAYYTTASGAGVLSTGTMRWVGSVGGNCGTRVKDVTTRATANVLEAFAAGPAGLQHPAEGGATEVDTYPGDAVAARRDLW
ncbi:hypothetical protein EV189_3111 [Motilibacter rhizosphaerae]|uniref:N,N-dimethylformamidase beta subunit-like C-terminal domain-containing protein n=1 Tax=Motilibacter rhizosphaerae TaxID=598652 RepID=A0A4Q7NGZ1_9ACTN|nr:N,N-dimethylformamidase beta subunit family domain-containing protein [Motilibacter rhizosphaerae]RZS82716.1 hypothetical protein EV189_3111 [Motilibacter rhizosphaerae]